MRIIIPSYTSRLGLPAKACVHTRLYLRLSISASYRSVLAMAAAYEGGFILLVDSSSAWSHGPKTIQPYQHTYGTSHASQAKDLKMGHEDREWYCSLNINPDVHLPTVPPTTAITHPAISTPTSYVDTVKAVPVIQWCTKTKKKKRQSPFALFSSCEGILVGGCICNAENSKYNSQTQNPPREGQPSAPRYHGRNVQKLVITVMKNKGKGTKETKTKTGDSWYSESLKHQKCFLPFFRSQNARSWK